MYIQILLLFILSIFFYNFLLPIEEGLENKSCESDINTLVYKNSGTIKHLQETVNALMKQVTSMLTKDSKQDSDILLLKDNESKYSKIANEANNLAKENKERLMELAKQAQKTGQRAQSESDNIPSMK